MARIKTIFTIIIIFIIALFLLLSAFASGVYVLTSHKLIQEVRALQSQNMNYEKLLSKQQREQFLSVWWRMNDSITKQQVELKSLSKKEREARMRLQEQDADTLTIEELIKKYDLPSQDLGR
jgi:hypothetical protein